jgi:hypothetical protein
MRTLIGTIPLLESGPSDLNQNLLTNIKCEYLAIRAEFLYENHNFLMQFLAIL